MNTHDNGRAEARSRATGRLRRMTIGTTMLAAAATATFGWLAAATDDGAIGTATVTGADTAIVTGATSASDTSAAATATTSTTTTTPVVTTTTGTAIATSGGS